MSARNRTPADPFLQHVPMPHRAVLNVLGVPVEFESNARWLLALADDAYGALPACATSSAGPVRVRLLANNDMAIEAIEQPPQPRMFADGTTVSAIITPADSTICVPALGRALVTVSSAMRAFPYHVRYEMIEFACYRLVSHHLRAVGLHAACIAKDNRAWLIFGESGAGKSTFTFASMQRGWDLIAEDSVFVLPDDPVEVRGVSTFLHLLDDALKFFPNVNITSQLITRRSGTTKNEIDVRATFARPMRVSAPLAGLIFLGARRDAPKPMLRRLTPAQVTKRLTSTQPFAPNYARWPEVSALLAAKPAFALSAGSDVWQSVDALELVTRDS